MTKPVPGHGHRTETGHHVETTGDFLDADLFESDFFPEFLDADFLFDLETEDLIGCLAELASDFDPDFNDLSGLRCFRLRSSERFSGSEKSSTLEMQVNRLIVRTSILQGHWSIQR